MKGNILLIFFFYILLIQINLFVYCRFSQGGNATTPADNSETTNKVVKGKKKVAKKMIKKSSEGRKPSGDNENTVNEGNDN
jgi:hypothetical protein